MVKIVVLSKLPINQIFRINVLLNLWANYASINLQKNFPLLDMGPNYGLTCTLLPENRDSDNLRLSGVPDTG